MKGIIKGISPKARLPLGKHMDGETMASKHYFPLRKHNILVKKKLL